VELELQLLEPSKWLSALLCSPAVIKDDFITKAEYMQLGNYFLLGQQIAILFGNFLVDFCPLKYAILNQHRKFASEV
jgi:hypothetical protein